MNTDKNFTKKMSSKELLDITGIGKGKATKKKKKGY